MSASFRSLVLLAMIVAFAGVTTVAAENSTAKARGTPKPVSADGKTPVAASGPARVRYYYVYVVTTESRIPHRYIYRYGSQLNTGSQLSIVYNNNRLQIPGADLTILRR